MAQPPAMRGRALTAPIVPNAHEIGLGRSLTNYAAFCNRDRHAVPPSVLAQNQQLLSGIPDRPRLTTHDAERYNTDITESGSSEDLHIETSQGTVHEIPLSRRRSTFHAMSENARKTGSKVKRKISKVVPGRRKDSARQDEDEQTSPPNKAPRLYPERENQDYESRSALLRDEQPSAQFYEENAGDTTSFYTVDEPYPSSEDELSGKPSSPHRATADTEFGAVLTRAAARRVCMQTSVEFYNQHAIDSPDNMPHQSFAGDPWLAERLEKIANNPELVAARFDRIYRRLKLGEMARSKRAEQDSALNETEWEVKMDMYPASRDDHPLG